MIKQETIHAVQNAANIEEIIGSFITLKKKGQNLWACCPFHQERTPSFAVSPSKGYYKCFGCDAAGDAITFIREMEGISFVEAVKYLAHQYGIPVQENTNQTKEEQLQAQHEKDSLYILLNLAKEYYSHNLWQHPAGQQIAQAYFQKRGLTAPFIQQFELGYSLDHWQAFHEYAQQKGYSPALLEQVGLIRRKEDQIYDYFRGRLMFPIHNIAGKVIGFGARVLAESTNQPKYLNSPETIIYHKSDILYGIYQAKNKIKQADNCFVVEGYTDVIALHMAGIENVVATSGSALTQGQIRLISRFTKHLTLLFDGDTAGMKASLRGIDTILAMGLHVKIVLLPANEDPDSYARKLGNSAFEQYLQDNSQDFITYKTKLLMQGVQNDPVQKAAVIKEILQSIVVIPDAVTRAVFIKQCSELLAIDEGILLNEQNELLIQQEKEQQKADIGLRTKRNKLQVSAKAGSPTPFDWTANIVAYERESMRILLNYGGMELHDGKLLCEYLFQELADVKFISPIYQQILAMYQQQLIANKTVDASFFIQHQEKNIQKAAIDLTATPYAVSDQWQERYQIYIPQEADNLFQTAYKNILRLKLRLIQQLIEENTQTLKQNTDAQEQDKILQIHVALKQSEVAITQQLGIVVIS